MAPFQHNTIYSCDGTKLIHMGCYFIPSFYPVFFLLRHKQKGSGHRETPCVTSGERERLMTWMRLRNSFSFVCRAVQRTPTNREQWLKGIYIYAATQHVLNGTHTWMASYVLQRGARCEQRREWRRAEAERSLCGAHSSAPLDTHQLFLCGYRKDPYHPLHSSCSDQVRRSFQLLPSIFYFFQQLTLNKLPQERI